MSRLVGLVTKEYGKEIITEGSKSVIGLEDHIDRMIAEILEIESDIVTVARKWRKVIERAAMTEGIDKVKIILEQEIKDTISRKEELTIQENKSDIEMVDQTNSTKSDDNIEATEVLLEANQLSASKENKANYSLMEDIKEIQEKETNLISSNQYYDTTEESEEDILTADSDSSLERSIWAPNKDDCEEKGNIRAKVAAIKVLGSNANYRERSLRWSMGRNVHLKEITEKFERGNLWCILNFDCKKGYEEARMKLENKKEDYEQAKLILEENVEEDKDKKN